jgi:hypothetical protein
MRRPWGIQAIGDMYSGGVGAGLPDGRWVAAVAEPYASNVLERVRAAWWVLTGRAVAFVWPKPGDLEEAMKPPPMQPARSHRQNLELLRKIEKAEAKSWMAP